MRVKTLRRLRLTRLRAALMVASALTVPLTGTPASAATSDGSAPTASRAVAQPAVAFPYTSTQFLNDKNFQCLWNSGFDSLAKFVPCPPTTSDLWSVRDLGGNNYEIIDPATNQCLTAFATNSGGLGAIIALDYCQFDNGRDIWKLVVDPSGRLQHAYQIKNLSYNLCMVPASAGAPVQLFDCDPNGMAALWTALPAHA
jgi:hypothetical protein